MAFRLLSPITLATSVAALVSTVWNGTSYACKCYHDDACWPTRDEWSKLNSSVAGRLVVDVPPGSVCHDTFEGPLGTLHTYNAAQCTNVSTLFYEEQWTTDQPAAELWTYYTNETCRPTTDPSDPCTLGFYGVYVILATEYEHIKAGIDFAREHQLRLIVRNTGHDFLGRSTGWGALVINTHSFQNATFSVNYEGPGNYTGPSVRVGAGVQGRQLLRQANAENPPLALVVGECPTVGPSGGFIQGGGHGPMTTMYGLAADNVLEFEVLTADGEYKVANSESNIDLFWALRGGGPAAYAVILSTTFRAYEDVPSSGAILNINSTHTTNETLFWEAVSIFLGYSNHFVDSGLYVYYELTDLRLHIQPFVAINQTTEQLDTILQPLFDDLNSIGLSNYFTTTKGFDTLFDLYIDLFEDEEAGVSAVTGGWAFAHEDVANNNDGIAAAFQNAIAYGAGIIGHIWDPGHNMPIPNSATNPRFRNTSDFAIIALSVATNATWEEKEAAQALMTYNLDQAFREAGPNGCGYVNEGDPNQPDWQTHFYGTNYPELLTIRQKWDPTGVFYSIATPGTEDWEVIDYGTRLCKRVD
ncbi:FAD-binding domain-containing protein [Cryphonectria parasitica EP155]|uniref:FAD-binding domain-containing protein n=1 Tax=Cryphonectria parasitica (strain ATCC 38755 / EP155) TaxID=660469 RepID=A0A9P4YD75_CRYP1|nr:FAD-binding domain-containing protein [Cryphonectria parasitica EP155]KAF3771369.1 FAD-binding domain-containing protein [Cryphonectria parasitica EP155]